MVTERLKPCPFCEGEGEIFESSMQIYIDRGLFDLKTTVIQNSDGTTKITHITKVTGKGQIYFINGFVSGKFKIKQEVNNGK